MKLVLRTSEVKFAHFAKGKTSLSACGVNFAGRVSFTYLRGKLSFSVFLIKDNTLIAVTFCFQNFSRYSIRHLSVGNTLTSAPAARNLCSG